MKEKRIIELLEFILKNEQDSLVRQSTLFGEGFTGTELNLCVRSGLIGYEDPDYFLLSNGVGFLNQHYTSKNIKKLKDTIKDFSEKSGGYSKKLNKTLKDFSENSKKDNKRMIKYTKTLKLLTWFLLAFTILNFVSILVQINLNSKQSQNMEDLTQELINYVNKTVKQGETQIVLTGEVVTQTEGIKKSLDEMTEEQSEIEEESKEEVAEQRRIWTWIIIGIVMVGLVLVGVGYGVKNKK